MTQTVTLEHSGHTEVMPVFNDPAMQAGLERYGYVVIDLFSEDEIAALADLFAHYANRHGPGFSATLLSEDLAYRAEVHEMLSPFLAPCLDEVLNGYRSIAAGFVTKATAEQGNEGALMLHQDITMAATPAGRPPLSFWAPLVDVGPINGCLKLLPGSHTLCRAERAPGTPGCLTGIAPDEVEPYLIVLPMRAGQAILFDQSLFHGSDPNCGALPRPVLAAPLVPAETGLRYLHRRPEETPPTVEVHDVPQDFFRRHHIGTPPEGSTPVALRPEATTRATEADLAALPRHASGETVFGLRRTGSHAR
ncbi:MAG: phytanoyl-CoA dioxygenase family protein [Acidihalobacter sp.]